LHGWAVGEEEDLMGWSACDGIQCGKVIKVR
jgi:hypothetical protein